MRWPAWSHAVSSFVPSASSMRIPQTNSATRMFREAMALSMRALASPHFTDDCKLSVGSSIVSASCGRSAFLAPCAGLLSKKAARVEKGVTGAHTSAVPALRADERNLRRFIRGRTSAESVQPVARPLQQG